MTLWTAEEAVKATGGKAHGDWQASGVSIDTRTIQPGDLFVALSAARDGHEFVAQALDKGAAAALVSHVPDGVGADAPLLLVDDVLQALEAMGRHARARTDARVVAVTGSVGKTSAKEMFRTVLAQQGKTHAAEASYNNHWGVPLTLARMPQDTEFAVLEIGMNHPGEIEPLARLVRPHVAMITTVAAAHLEAFENIEGIAAEKGSVFKGLEPGGVAVFNADLPTSPILAEMANQADATPRPFGSDDPTWRLIAAHVDDATTRVEALVDGLEMEFLLATPGRHFAMNALGVLASVAAMGADVAKAAEDMARWHPPAGRGVRMSVSLGTGVFELIDDAFNANPTSLAASLDVLAAANPANDGRRVAILGDMLELGPREAEMHAEIGQLPAISEMDVVHCVGPRMLYLWQALPIEKRGQCTETAEELAEQAAALVSAGDIVLVKGSKGSKVSLVVTSLCDLSDA